MIKSSSTTLLLLLPLLNLQRGPTNHLISFFLTLVILMFQWPLYQANETLVVVNESTVTSAPYRRERAVVLIIDSNINRIEKKRRRINTE